MSDNKRVLIADDSWLVRLFVLIRAEKARVSESELIAALEESAITGITTAKIRSLLRSLVANGCLRELDGHAGAFVATKRGKLAAVEARARILRVLADGNSASKPGHHANRRVSG
jgi:hypothetical protein